MKLIQIRTIHLQTVLPLRLVLIVIRVSVLHLILMVLPNIPDIMHRKRLMLICMVFSLMTLPVTALLLTAVLPVEAVILMHSAHIVTSGSLPLLTHLDILHTVNTKQLNLQQLIPEPI